jgi:small-conductance mechanosensitive channel
MQQITEVDVFASFAMHATELLVPWAVILISAMAALAMKDFASNLMAGIAFRYSSPFKEGDHVIIDGNDAMVIKVGITETVFGRYSDRGYTWRYVPNREIHSIRIEKLIRQDLHVDSDIEKGERLLALIKKADDAYRMPGDGYTNVKLETDNSIKASS